MARVERDAICPSAPRRAEARGPAGGHEGTVFERLQARFAGRERSRPAVDLTAWPREQRTAQRAKVHGHVSLEETVRAIMKGDRSRRADRALGPFGPVSALLGCED